MYACIYVGLCMYVCRYVCMYVCNMYVCRPYTEVCFILSFSVSQLILVSILCSITEFIGLADYIIINAFITDMYNRHSDEELRFLSSGFVRSSVSV